MPESGAPLHLREQLDQTRSLAETGRYGQALDVIRSLKANHARNVYILAFERQLEQLNELSQQGTLTEEQKLDILESFPGISERALAGGSIDTFQQAPEGQAERDKVAALEWLKNQYFQHAHEYVRKGEYQNALAEIRRVYVIEPENRIAPEFEQQIVELSRLRAQERVKAAAPLLGLPANGVSPPVSQASANLSASSPAEAPELSKDNIGQSQPETASRGSPAEAGASRQKRSKPRYLLWVLIVIALIAAAILLLWKGRSEAGGAPESRLVTRSAQERTICISSMEKQPPTGSPWWVRKGAAPGLAGISSAAHIRQVISGPSRSS